MESNTRSSGQVVVVNPQGRVNEEGGAHSPLRDRLLAEIERGQESIFLDVGLVTYLDSMLLGELVQAYASAIKRGATLKLVHATKRLRELLRVTKLDRVLETVDSEEPHG